jgi:hypothetical protein
VHFDAMVIIVINDVLLVWRKVLTCVLNMRYTP